ncbi:ACT domain-containing protein [Frankia sp. CNm7]|uniref:ACT domain-containing protein n=1 Tax=Frankia nepalensis TaxID=1836974 RepID=A0A937RAA1_9ACTN|nr:ACT domain-containing protein [Frankia nepalensis]MBL7499817.1 ACT domain-containing protein [Frankia nepalensis]MBL7511679.1 ACT domain-containing protein [Frankia nepalensis]MBL7523531.1 ACT domain-containing protein [Frankia nepalensis]MBL7628341.1 ACT domain-containing protein [Frankia nepalensis]
MSYLLRLLLPDRPGALGAVATALGRVGIDIVSLAVVERSADGAVDDLVVQLPPGGLADSAVTAAQSVPGVRVESLRPFLADGAGVADDLDLVDALTDRPGDASALLAELVAGVFHADWAILLECAGPGDVRIREASVGAPDLGGGDYASPPRAAALPWLPLPEAREIDPGEGGLPARWAERGMQLAAAPVGCPELVILVGRPGGPTFRSSEIARLAHLAGITASLSRRPAR